MYPRMAFYRGTCLLEAFAGTYASGVTRRMSAMGKQEARHNSRVTPPAHTHNAGQADQGTGAGNTDGHKPHGMDPRAPCERISRSARTTEQGGGEGDTETARARPHKQTTGTWPAPEGQPDRACGTHRLHGMASQQVRETDTKTGQTATRTARDVRGGQQGGGGYEQGHWPLPPRAAASAAQTPPGHGTHQGSSGAQHYARAPRLGSLRASSKGPRSAFLLVEGFKRGI